MQFIVELDEHELKCRIIETITGRKRPRGVTARRAFELMDDENAMAAATRAVEAVMDYLSERYQVINEPLSDPRLAHLPRWR